MSHLDYYHYQSEARGVRSLEDVQRIAREKSYLYDRLVHAWLPTDTTRPIGELACGHGSFLQWLHSRGFTNIAGVDSSEEQVALARQVGAHVDLDDVNRWLARQPNNYYSALVAIDLAEHLSKDDFMDLLRCASAALSPGGSLILRLPNGDSPLVGMNLFNDITHVWTYTPNCLNSLSQMHGFSRTEFASEGYQTIRDQRWLKVPLGWLSALLLRVLLQAATREKPRNLGPNLWARLVK
jgi:2-polyprenyl-3-methyl-5-hydroxy-6-metoxy-1,4-benzoquinol methylase